MFCSGKDKWNPTISDCLDIHTIPMEFTLLQNSIIYTWVNKYNRISLSNEKRFEKDFNGKPFVAFCVKSAGIASVMGQDDKTYGRLDVNVEIVM